MQVAHDSQQAAAEGVESALDGDPEDEAAVGGSARRGGAVQEDVGQVAGQVGPEPGECLHLLVDAGPLGSQLAAKAVVVAQGGLTAGTASGPACGRLRRRGGNRRAVGRRRLSHGVGVRAKPGERLHGHHLDGLAGADVVARQLAGDLHRLGHQDRHGGRRHHDASPPRRRGLGLDRLLRRAYRARGRTRRLRLYRGGFLARRPLQRDLPLQLTHRERTPALQPHRLGLRSGHRQDEPQVRPGEQPLLERLGEHGQARQGPVALHLVLSPARGPAGEGAQVGRPAGVALLQVELPVADLHEGARHLGGDLLVGGGEPAQGLVVGAGGDCVGLGRQLVGASAVKHLRTERNRRLGCCLGGDVHPSARLDHPRPPSDGRVSRGYERLSRASEYRAKSRACQERSLRCSLFASDPWSPAPSIVC